MKNQRNGSADWENMVDGIKEMVGKSKAENSLKELNEYLRDIIMGPYGDTKFDVEEVKRQLAKNNKWKKNALRKS